MENLNQQNLNDSLTEWWNHYDFPEKQWVKLLENGDLVLNSGKERIIAQLQLHSAAAQLKSLVEKFEEVQSKFNQLKAEWEQNFEPSKLHSKLIKLKEISQKTAFIGPIEPITAALDKQLEAIHKISSENSHLKKQILQDLEKLLTANTLNWKEQQAQFNTLLQNWKEVGYIDKNQNDQLWQELEAFKLKFAENKRIQQEAHSHEMLQNLDLKMELVEKAEQLSLSEVWKETSEQFKQLMEDWKKIGHTLQDKNEQLWQRFIEAKNTFFERKKAHTDQIKTEQEKNYQQKLALTETAEQLQHSNDWQKTANQYNELMLQWKAIGPIPIEFVDSLWNRFIAAKNHFYDAKKVYAEAFKSKLQENFDQKTTLIEQAIAQQESSQWRETTLLLNELLEQWKKLGNAGKEHNDVLWEKFLAARKYFFNRKDNFFKEKNEQYQSQREEKLEKLSALLETMKKENIDEAQKIKEIEATLVQAQSSSILDQFTYDQKRMIHNLEQRIQNRSHKIADIEHQIVKLKEQNQSNATHNKP